MDFRRSGVRLVVVLVIGAVGLSTAVMAFGGTTQHKLGYSLKFSGLTKKQAACGGRAEPIVKDGNRLHVSGVQLCGGAIINQQAYLNLYTDPYLTHVKGKGKSMSGPGYIYINFSVDCAPADNYKTFQLQQTGSAKAVTGQVKVGMDTEVAYFRLKNCV